MDIPNDKFLALDNEIRTSIKLIKLGIGELQNISMSNDFYHLPFQLLSSGFERLLKSILCINFFVENDKLPSLKYLKDGGNGHDILNLKNLFLKDLFVAEVPVTEKDGQFLSNDDLLQKLLHLLTEFGKYSRYHNLNILLNMESQSLDVGSEWQLIESQILEEKELLDKLMNSEKNDLIIEEVTKHIIIKLERFTRSICRQFTLGKLGNLGPRFTGYIGDFIYLQDKELGTINYNVDTSFIQENRYEAHKRNMFDKLKSKIKSDYIRKSIQKKEFEEWPFYVDEVEIECRENYWFVVSIDGYDYALNGAAASRYKLPNVHKYGVAKKGLSIHQIIDKASKLCEEVP
jgi:hypothetical protein